MRFHLCLVVGLPCLCSSFLSTAQTPTPLESPGRNRGWYDSRVASSSIVGIVKTADGKPIDNATVELYGVTLAPVFVYTSDDGGFRIENLSIGEYEIVAKLNLDEVRGHVSVMTGENWVNLVIPANDPSKGKGATVSAAQLAVPGKARNELQKAKVALLKHKLDEAARFLEKALILWPKYAEAFVLRAAIERQRNEPQLAAADAEKAVEYDPNDPSAYFVLGSAYNDLRRSDDAIRTLDHGIVIGPNYWQGYYEMSRAFLVKGDFTRALGQAEKSSSLAPPDFAALHLVKAYAYMGLRNSAAARSELETYLKLKPTFEGAEDARQLLARLPVNGR